MDEAAVTQLELPRSRRWLGLLRNRWPQLVLRLIALAGFMLAIMAGLLGTPVGNRNFAIIMVWIAWWAVLILVAVPLLGRAWCSICPIPLPGEWLQQGTILKPSGKPRKGLLSRLVLGKRWPNPLRNIWLQNAAFSLLALFSIVVLTEPRLTGLVLVGLILMSVATSLIFERRAFCRYLCPVGGFIGLYSQTAPIELRIKDRKVCAAHTVKTCYTGNAEGYGCPWQVFPPGLVKNTYCGLCLECIRTCPYDNIGINLRPFGADLAVPRERKLDEAFKAFIMLGSGLIYMTTLLGPWGALKSAAGNPGSLGWLLYATIFLAIIFGVLPGFFYVLMWLGKHLSRTILPASRLFIQQSYALIPLGLGAWIAFSLGFVFASASYILPALSDPLGWGWNLLGTTGMSWTPYLMAQVPVLQAIILAGGLVWSGMIARKISNESQSAHPDWLTYLVIIFCFFVTLTAMGLLIG